MRKVLTLDELHAAVPDELRVTELPPEVADAIEYLEAKNELRHQGVPDFDIPSYDEWRVHRG